MRHPGLLPGICALGLALSAQAPPRLEQGGNASITADLPEAPDLARAIEPLAAQIHAAFGRVIAQAPAGLDRGARGESPLGFFLADVLRAETAKAVPGVRIAFTNAGGIRRDLPAGPVHVGDVYEVIPFDDEVVVAEYSGAEVAAILREAIQHRGGEPVSGVRARVEGSAEQPRFSCAWDDGSPIDPAALVRIATTDYLLANGDATPTLRLGRHVIRTSIPMRQMVIDTCERLGQAGRPIQAPQGGRYLFPPAIAAAIQARTFHF